MQAGPGAATPGVASHQWSTICSTCASAPVVTCMLCGGAITPASHPWRTHAYLWPWLCQLCQRQQHPVSCCTTPHVGVHLPQCVALVCTDAHMHRCCHEHLYSLLPQLLQLCRSDAHVWQDVFQVAG